MQGGVLTGINVQLGASFGCVRPSGSTSVGPSRFAPSRIGTLKGFGKAETQMMRNAQKALGNAGYDVSRLEELIRADLPAGSRAMTVEGGAALGSEAFSSQSMLNHVLEEELRHLQQKAAGLGAEFSPGTARALEEAVDAIREFPLPK